MNSGSELRDITVIGGGPTGLFALFYAGMRGISARLVDNLPELGGQLVALYPEKDIFDMAGFPRVLSKELARGFIEQALQFDHEIRLGEQVDELIHQEDGHFILTTDKGSYPTKTVLIAAGKGSFSPRKLKVPGFEEFRDKGVYSHVKDPEGLRGKRVLIVGGGDSAFDWAWNLCGLASELTLIHRSDRYRAHAKTVSDVRGAAERGELQLLPFHEVRAMEGDGRIERVRIFHNKSSVERVLEVDSVLALIGFVPKLGAIADWGLELEGNTIVVDSTMRTTVTGVYAAGDIANYEGKLELIVNGAAEAAIAVNNAVHFVDPTQKVNPGHSTHAAVFREKQTSPD